MRRASIPEQDRPDATLYVDETHNYLSLPTPLAEMLAEARGYRLSLCLAHQHLGQLPKEMREAIAANARTKILFQLSTEDAAALERSVAPELHAHDLAHLPAHTAAVRLCHGGETGPAFTLSTEPLPAANSQRAEEVRTAARERAGTPREEVESLLAQRQGQPAAGGDKEQQALARERRRSDTREEPAR